MPRTTPKPTLNGSSLHATIDHDNGKAGCSWPLRGALRAHTRFHGVHCHEPTELPRTRYVVPACAEYIASHVAERIKHRVSCHTRPGCAASHLLSAIATFTNLVFLAMFVTETTCAMRGHFIEVEKS